MITVVSSVLAILAFLSAIFIVLTLLSYLLKALGNTMLHSVLHQLFSPLWLETVLVVSLVPTLGSLFYSEIAHFTPCVLCWYQRIFMYPQPLLAYLGVVRREKTIRPYLLTLSVVGLLISIYHNALQLFPKVFLSPCSVSSAVSCAKWYPVAFGFVTIPEMSMTAFLLLIVLLTVYAPTSGSRKSKGR